MLIGKELMLPAVSVLIPTYTRTRILGEALYSVLAQTYPGKVEIVVCNDQPRQTLLAPPTPPPANMALRLLNRPEVFESLGAKRHAMLFMAQNEWVVFLDDDDLWMPWHLDSLFRGILGREPVSAIFPKQQYRCQLGAWSYEDVPGGINGIGVRAGVARSIGFDRTLNVGEDNAFRNEITNRTPNIYRPSGPSHVYRPTAPVMHISRSLRGTTVDRSIFLQNAEGHLDAGREPSGDVVLRPAWDIDYLEMIRGVFPETVPSSLRRARA